MRRDTYYDDQRVARAYDAEHAGRDIATDDIPFYVGLAKEAHAAGQSVLELACGTGRVTLPIAEAGVSVTGLDGSPAMLEVARGKSAGLGNPRWVEGDMRSFALEDPFGLVIIPFRSFLHLLTVADQKACLQRIHAHLIEGGRLALNFFNPNLAMMASWLNKEPKLRRLVERQGNRERWESLYYSTAGQTLDYETRDDRLSDNNATVSRVYRNLHVRYVYRYEMEHLLALCGFEVEALCGWFDGRAFDDDSSEMVWTARKVSTSDQ
jgi:ubiquinone/menaquinone biosynthesis C-methylase UbiE